MQVRSEGVAAERDPGRGDVRGGRPAGHGRDGPGTPNRPNIQTGPMSFSWPGRRVADDGGVAADGVGQRVLVEDVDARTDQVADHADGGKVDGQGELQRRPGGAGRRPSRSGAKGLVMTTSVLRPAGSALDSRVRLAAASTRERPAVVGGGDRVGLAGRRDPAVALVGDEDGLRRERGDLRGHEPQPAHADDRPDHDAHDGHDEHSPYLPEVRPRPGAGGRRARAGGGARACSHHPDGPRRARRPRPSPRGWRRRSTPLRSPARHHAEVRRKTIGTARASGNQRV